MKLEQLEIENFKCFKSKKTFDFGRITVLTGANSSGKSTVMQAILGALQTDDFPFYYSPNGKYVNLGDYKEIVNVNSDENSFLINIKTDLLTNFLDTISTKWEQDSISFLPNLLNFTVKSDTGIITVNKYLNDDVTFTFTFYKVQIAEQLFDEIKIRKDVLEKYDKIRLSWLDADLTVSINVKDFIEIVHLTMEKLDIDSKVSILTNILRKIFFIIRYCKFDSNGFNYIGAFRLPPSRSYLEQSKANFDIDTQGNGYIDQIVDWEKRSNGKIKKLIEVLRGLDLLEEIKVNRLSGGRFELLVRAKNSKILTSLTNVGFGISQFMPIIVADLQLSDDSTLFLAEPEIHLHPSIQAKFADYLIHQITTTEKNYVIETHSEYFLNRLRLAIVKGELKKEDFKIYFLENNGEDTEVFDIDFTKTGAIKNAPKNFFETYFVDSMDIALNAFAE
jgi:predicted ATPase